MGIIISIANQKGGVGKTSVCVNLGKTMSIQGKRCLFLDFDPQNNLGDTLAPELASMEGFANGEHPSNVFYMFSGIVEAQPYVVNEFIHVMGSSKKLASVTQDNMFDFADSLDKIKDNYDYIFIDCPPSVGALQHTALAVSERVLIVTQAEGQSIKGVDKLMNTQSQIKKRLNPELEVIGIVINLSVRPSPKNQAEKEAELRKDYPSLVFESKLYKTVRVSEALETGLALAEYSPKHAEDFGFNKFVDEFQTRLEAKA
ncbi:ParA family protein [Vibrio europaeus]|uniref:ParA family protein n=1 Tax=Vibrio europaeus TaxID=300876 RepID=UPI00233FDDC7|nr:ParA family protein [Vibrio europaeus]MDC5841085.1 ParA family protein [Vibrio europaeus]